MNHKEPQPDDTEEEEEEDFMSDKFLKSDPSAISTSRKNEGCQHLKNSMTYSENRKRKLIESEKKSKSNQKKSRSIREIEARQIGLNRNLIEEELKNQIFKKDEDQIKKKNESVFPIVKNRGLEMMLKMGFKPGFSLGINKEDQRGNQPIDIITKSGRSGIGIETKKQENDFMNFNDQIKININSNHQEDQLKLETEDEHLNREKFLEYTRNRFDMKKVNSILGRASRTCQELDTRNGLLSNILWIRDDESSRTTINDQSLRPLTELRDESEHLINEESEEIQRWLNLEPSTRLSFTLDYLRQHHSYCIWCGCQFQSLEELERECPGEEEDDH